MVLLVIAEECIIVPNIFSAQSLWVLVYIIEYELGF